MLKFVDRQKTTLIIISLTISFVFYGVYLYPHYASDSYRDISAIKFLGFTPISVWSNICVKYLSVGRFATAGLIYFFSLIGLNVVENNMLVNAISIILFGISLFLLVFRINSLFMHNGFGDQKIGVASLVFLVPLFMNPLYSDIFHFSEFIICFSIGLLIITAMSLEMCLGSKSSVSKNIIYTIMTVIMLSIHQVLLNIFVIYSVMCLFLRALVERRDIKSLCKHYRRFGWIFFIYCFSAFSQLVVIHKYGGERMNTNYVHNILTVLSMQKRVWFMQGTGSFNILLVACTIITALGSILIPFKKKSFFSVLVMILFCVFVVGTIFSSHIIAEPWLSNRSIVPLYSVPGVFGIIFLFKYKLYEVKKRYMYIGFIVLMLLLNLTYIERANNIAISTHKNNIIDKQVALQISQKILDYEKETGIYVSKVSFRNDLNITYINPEVFVYADLNIRAFTTPWGRKGLVELGINRRLEEVDMSEEIYNKYFEGKDWSTFQEEQVEIIGDTAYIMIY